jgi:hypothetical protein
VLTAADNPTIAADMLVLRLTGPMVPPTARDSAAARQASRAAPAPRPRQPGGSLVEAEAIIAALAAIRAEARVKLVRHGALCASAPPVARARTGRRRGNAWSSTAPADQATNVPSLALTERYLAILRAAGVDERFLTDLVARAT